MSLNIVVTEIEKNKIFDSLKKNDIIITKLTDDFSKKNKIESISMFEILKLNRDQNELKVKSTRKVITNIHIDDICEILKAGC